MATNKKKARPKRRPATRKKPAKRKTKKKQRKPKRKPNWIGSKVLRTCRLSLGWTLAQATHEIYDRTRVAPGQPGVDISRQSLQQYETGTEPSATAILAILDVYKLEARDLLPKTPEDLPPKK